MPKPSLFLKDLLKKFPIITLINMTSDIEY